MQQLLQTMLQLISWVVSMQLIFDSFLIRLMLVSC